jgi:hypothetical protein
MNIIIAGAIGLLLAIGSSFAIVQSAANAAPPVVDAPLVTYGTR